MSRQMRKEFRLAEAGTQNAIKSDMLSGATLNAGNEVTVWDKQVPADKIYAHGYGSDNRNSGRSAYIYASVMDGSGNPVEGDLVAVITDSEQRDVLARYEVGDLETLADAEADDRTDRPLYPVLAPAAREDRHLELRIEADAASDGSVVDPSASSVRLYYTDINA